MKIICLVMFFCCFMMATSYAEQASKKETAASQNKSTTASTTSTTKVTTYSSQQLHTQLSQAITGQTTTSEKENYVNNKKYYLPDDNSFCEDYDLCKDWAYDMAKNMGKRFVILGESINTASELSSRSETHSSSGIDENGLPIAASSKSTIRIETLTRTTTIYYRVDREQKTKTFQCIMTKKENPSVEEKWDCKWI